MTRFFFSILLMAAIVFSGTIPRALMADTMPNAAVQSAHYGMEMHDQAKSMHHNGSNDQADSCSCAITCAAPIADWPQNLIAIPVTFAAVIRWAPIANIKHGRSIDPVDRPPQSI